MTSKIEYEHQYLDFDENLIKEKLISLRAVKKGIFLFKSFNFKPKGPFRLIRVRDEGYRITMTKKSSVQSSQFESEDEIIVDNFEAAIELLKSQGFEKLYYVEKLREIYYVNGCEVIFDHTPGMITRLEIEGPSEVAVNELGDDLNLIPNKTSIAKIFAFTYNIPDIKSLNGDLTFDNVIKKYITAIRRNHEQFIAHVEKQRTLLKQI